MARSSVDPDLWLDQQGSESDGSRTHTGETACGGSQRRAMAGKGEMVAYQLGVDRITADSLISQERLPKIARAAERGLNFQVKMEKDHYRKRWRQLKTGPSRDIRKSFPFRTKISKASINWGEKA